MTRFFLGLCFAAMPARCVWAVDGESPDLAARPFLAWFRLRHNPGDEVTFTVMVENFGPQSTAKVEVTDKLDACLEFVSADTDKGSYDPVSGVCS